MEINVHEYSNDPDEYWKKYFKSSKNVIELRVEHPSSEVSMDKVRK